MWKSRFLARKSDTNKVATFALVRSIFDCILRIQMNIKQRAKTICRGTIVWGNRVCCILIRHTNTKNSHKIKYSIFDCHHTYEMPHLNIYKCSNARQRLYWLNSFSFDSLLNLTGAHVWTFQFCWIELKHQFLSFSVFFRSRCRNTIEKRKSRYKIKWHSTNGTASSK